MSSVTVDPLVLLNISDHLTRKQVQNIVFPAIGLILGTRSSSGDLQIRHSIAYLGNSVALSERVTQFRVIHPSFEVLGVYSMSTESDSSHLQTLASSPGFQELYHLEISFQAPSSSIPFTLTRCVLSNGCIVPAENVEIVCAPCKCGKVVISDLAQSDSRSGDWDAQLKSEMGVFERAKATFNEKIGNMLQYEKMATSDEIKGDPELIEEIGNLKAELEAGVIPGNIPNEISVQAIVRMALAMKRYSSTSASTRLFQKVSRVPPSRSSR